MPLHSSGQTVRPREPSQEPRSARMRSSGIVRPNAPVSNDRRVHNRVENSHLPFRRRERAMTRFRRIGGRDRGAAGTRNDNYSTRGNVNPHTGEPGTKPRDGEAPGPDEV